MNPEAGPSADARVRGERGSAVALLAVALAAVALTVGVLAVGGALVERQRSIDAADAAALAAADASSGAIAGTPCDVADETADANESALVGCAVEGDGVAEVTVSTPILGGDVSASARAGPP